MESLKKHIEIYKINRKIGHLRREAATDVIAPFQYIGNVPYQTQSNFPRPSEKNEIIRQVINSLLDERESIRRA